MEIKGNEWKFGLIEKKKTNKQRKEKKEKEKVRSSTKSQFN